MYDYLVLRHEPFRTILHKVGGAQLGATPRCPRVRTGCLIGEQVSHPTEPPSTDQLTSKSLLGI